MPYTHISFGAKDGRRHTLGTYPTVQDALWDVQVNAWAEPSRLHVDCIMDEATGEVCATLIFGSGLDVLVTLMDGLRVTYPYPGVR